jgi:hypothetical protein
MDAAPRRPTFRRTAVLLCAMAMLLGLAGEARATFGQSNVFAFDTRDSNSTHYAESGVFAFDTRAFDGRSGSRASGLFSFDTRQASAAQLRVSGPPTVVGGTPATYRALLQYPDGAAVYVTEDAGWGFAGSEPIATTFSHSSFTPAPGDAVRYAT